MNNYQKYRLAAGLSLSLACIFIALSEWWVALAELGMTLIFINLIRRNRRNDSRKNSATPPLM